MAESSYSASSDSPPPVSGTTETRKNRDSIKKGFSDIMKFADVNFTRARQVCMKTILHALLRLLLSDSS